MQIISQLGCYKKINCHLPLEYLPFHKRKSNSYLYLAFCLVRRGSLWKISQPGATGHSDFFPILATPFPKARARWKKKNSKPLAGRQKMSPNARDSETSKKRLWTITLKSKWELFLNNCQVLRGSPHWGEKYGRITDATCVHEICRPAPCPAPWQKPWRNFSLGTWANIVFSSKE